MASRPPAAADRATRAAARVTQNLAAAELLVSRALGCAAQLPPATREEVRPRMLEMRSQIRALAASLTPALAVELDALASRFPDHAHHARHPEVTVSPELTDEAFAAGAFDTPAPQDHVDT